MHKPGRWAWSRGALVPRQAPPIALHTSTLALKQSHFRYFFSFVLLLAFFFFPKIAVAPLALTPLIQCSISDSVSINNKREGLTWSEGNPTAQTPRKMRSSDNNITEESSLLVAVRLEQISWRKPNSQTAIKAAQKLNTPKAQMTRADLHVDMLTTIVALGANLEITSIFWQRILSQQIR